MAVTKLSQIVKLNGSFRNSINLYLNLNKKEKIDSYIPTKSSLNILKRYVGSVIKNKDHSTILIGSYGKGKSHLLLILLAIVSMQRTKENNEIVKSLLKKIRMVDEETFEIVSSVWNKKGRFLPVIISGSIDDVSRSFMIALNDALKRENLMNLMPDTFFSIAEDTICRWKKEYPEVYINYEKALKKNGVSINDIKNGLKVCDPKALEVFKSVYPSLMGGEQFNPLTGNLGGKGGTYYCTIVKMLLSNSVNETTIHNFASDVRNRIEALLMTTNATSWKCIDQEFRVIPPEEKRARKVYVNVCLYLKSGKELQARVKKYGVALGKDAQKIQENINDRVAALEKNHDRTMQDMSDIWDDLYEVKNADDVEMLIDNIASVLQKGIPDADRFDFEELQKNLSELLNDINEIKRVTNSRNEFKKISEDMINKYEHSEFDFEVLPIIHEVISDMENNMNVREQEWINSVLTLGDKSRKAVHKWKEKTAYLPEYLSEETIEKVKMVDKEADEIISEGKIEDVLFYFDKLDDVEKLECIQKLQNRLNR